jgi:hypothetical protein
MENKTNWIKAYVVDVLPCISIAFFILSYVYYSAFYAVFGIDILQYATFGDILLGVTENLVNFAFVSLIAIGIGCFSYKNVKGYYNFQKNEIESENISEIDAVKYSAIIFISMVVSMIFIWILVTYFIDFLEKYIIDFDNVSFPFFLYFPLLIPTLYTFLQITMNKSKVIKTFLVNDKFFVILMSIFFYFHSFVMFGDLGAFDGLKRINRDNIKFEIRTVGGCLYNDTSYRYISHLGGNTFLYKIKTKENVILYDNNIEYSKIMDSDFHINFILQSYKYKLRNK